MKLLSLKFVALRYLFAIIFITSAGLIPNSAGLFLFVPVAVVNIKFLIYDGIAAVIKSKFPALKVSPWLLIGYTITVAWDMLFVYSATLRQTDAGFAFFGTFILTPWVLIATLVLIVVITYLKKRKI